MKKILVIGTGGTIGSVAKNSIEADFPLKIIDYISMDKNLFECVAPFNIFSENINLDFLCTLVDYLKEVDFGKYTGVILLHGSDTLAYTAALLSQIFENIKLVLVASNKPLESAKSNGVKNFECAAEYLLKSNTTGVFVSYDGIIPAHQITSADCTDTFVKADVPLTISKSKQIVKKNILVITPYPGINYDMYNIDSAQVILHAMYHSATVGDGCQSFCSLCQSKGKEVIFCTTKSAAEYESAKWIKNIWFNTTTESAFAKLLLTK